MRYLIFLCFLCFSFQSCAQPSKSDASSEAYEISKTEKMWKQELTDEEFRVLRKKGTERAFTSDLLDNKQKGTYICAACKNPLFSSSTKFKSGTGWPSFYDVINKTAIKDVVDNSFGMKRIETICQKCGSHLGHVFEDGPNPTGLRYCINGVALDFIKE